MSATTSEPAIREHVRRIIDAAPPLSDNQRQRIARLLTSTPAATRPAATRPAAVRPGDRR